MKDRVYFCFWIIFIVICACLSIFISKFIALSPLIIAIILGMVLSNLFKVSVPLRYGVIPAFCTKQILRFAIVLYGFRLTFQDILVVGQKGVLAGGFMLISTFFVGLFIGVKVLKLDKQLAILISAGSSICGAAAVLATQGVLKNSSYKSSVALSTVVIFGTLSMFLYPYFYSLGIFDLSSTQMAIYIGATLHEVAHVVAAGNAIGSQDVAIVAVVVKMIRVMLIAPFLLFLSFYMQKSSCENSKILVPWFAIFFILTAIFNSFDFLPIEVVEKINSFDTFLLCLAMFALGLGTKVDSFKKVGIKPLILATILFFWLVLAGFFIIKIL